jgi:hypothetical protein
MTSDKAALLRLFESPGASNALGETPPAPIEEFDPASLETDARTIRYVVRARETYADLRHCSAQLASLLLLATIDRRAGLADHPMLGVVREGLAAIKDEVWSETAPPSLVAHSDHLRRAAILLSAATREAGQKSLLGDERQVDRLLALVKEAWSEMRAAALAAPGFQVVSFGQSCCAAHAAPYQRDLQAN